MRLILVLVGISVLAAMALGFVNVQRHLWSEEVFFEDFSDNEARLTYLRGQGFLPDSDCKPRVEALEFVGWQDQWITFTLSAGQSNCHKSATSVLPDNVEEAGWRKCGNTPEGQGAERYTCVNP